MTDLMSVWAAQAGKLANAGVSVEMPTFIGWAETNGWGLDHLGGWYPETGRLYISEQIARVPLLVRDVMTHEITHQIQYGFTRGQDSGGSNGGPHGDLFRSTATRVAGILGCPSPVEALIQGWPFEQRADGYFGPGITRQTSGGM
jgi:hypothetical protein